MLEYLIPLFGSFLHPSLVSSYLYPALAISFLCILPDLIRRFIEWR